MNGIPEGGGIVGAGNEVLGGPPAATPPSQDYSALLTALGGKAKKDRGASTLKTKLGGSATSPNALPAGQMGPPELSLWQQAMRKFQ
jgi:hypothetical protein